jgi:hypothetical protein
LKSIHNLILVSAVGSVSGLALVACSSSSGTPESPDGSSTQEASTKPGHDSGSSHDAGQKMGGHDAGSSHDSSTPHDSGSSHDTGQSKDAEHPDVSTSEAGGEKDAKASDAKGDAVLDASFSPSALGTSLVLWLEADHGVKLTADSGTLGWTDQSTYGNNATLVANDAGASISLTATGIGGKPAVTFTGTNAYLSIADSTSLDFGTSNVYTWVVLEGDSPLAGSSRMVWSKQGENGPYIGFGLFMNLQDTYSVASLVDDEQFAIADAGSMAVFDNGSPFLLYAGRTADSLFITIGSHTASNSPDIQDAAANLTNTAALRIGGQGGTSQALTGSISAILIATGTLSPSDLIAVSGYLAAKYNVTQ